MPKAIWNGAVLAKSDRCEVVEGNYYFPPESINRKYFRESDTHTTCSWKGVANRPLFPTSKAGLSRAWHLQRRAGIVKVLIFLTRPLNLIRL